MIEVLRDEPDTAVASLVLAHGAGAGMTSATMATITRLLVQQSLRVFRFEFEYMAARRQGGSKRPPPKAETLTDEYVAAVEQLREDLGAKERLFIGGKSMGGRVASLIADDLFQSGVIAGLVCFGYPFHPVGRPEKLRTAHLQGLRCPALIVQGTRDPFGTREDVAQYALSPVIEVAWIEGGDHDFKGAGKGAMGQAIDAATMFMTGDATLRS